LTPHHPLLQTMPRIRPLPGHTPEPITLNAAWDAVAGKARLTWDASEDSALASYQLRMCRSAEYDIDAETVVATVAPNAARELLTVAGLASAGATASYKVYVILSTGNERGSNAVTVTRP
jgi:hypothetical protein